MRALILIAFRNLVKARRRTLLLSLATGGATLVLVVLLALAQGVQNNLVRTSLALQTAHINIAGFSKLTYDTVNPVVHDAPKLEQLIRSNVPEVTQVDARTFGGVRAVGGQGASAAFLVSMDVDKDKRIRNVLELVSQERPVAGESAAAMPASLNPLRKPGAVLIFEALAQRLEVEVGDSLTLISRTSTGMVNSADVTVSAIAYDVGVVSRGLVLAHPTTVRQLFQIEEGSATRLGLTLDDGERTRQNLLAVEEVLERHGYHLAEYRAEPLGTYAKEAADAPWTGRRLALSSWRDETASLTWTSELIYVLALVIGVVMVVLVAVGIGNAMLMAVRERTSEIGAMRAMGMSRPKVLLVFILEALFLTAFAAGGGSLLAWGVVCLLDSAAIVIALPAVQSILLSRHLHLEAQPTMVFLIALAITLLTTVAALWPAMRASRMQPLEAMSKR